MNTHNLIEISLADLDADDIPAVISLFDRWGRGGAVVEQIASDNGKPKVKTYLLPEDDDRLRQIEIGLALLNQAYTPSPSDDSLATRRLPEPHLRFLSETDWAEAWKADYHVLRVGRHLVIKPTWRDHIPNPDDLTIELDPGLAFGSGLHPTTRLCLEALEDYLRPGATVLDLGTGSGILSIAAARLGASLVLALDSDPLAVQVAGENVTLNQVEAVVHLEKGTIEPSNSGFQPSNLIVANILAETIIELTPALATGLRENGILIASGIIADRTEIVVASLREQGFSIVEQRNDGEWVALIACK